MCVDNIQELNITSCLALRVNFSTQAQQNFIDFYISNNKIVKERERLIFHQLMFHQLSIYQKKFYIRFV